MHIGPYRVVGELGRGGFGAVYEAVHEDSGLSVALKIVQGVERERRESIRREIEALAELHHPGVVAVHDWGMHAGSPWYAMGLLRGRRLRDLMGASEGQASTTKPFAGGDATVPFDAALRADAVATVERPARPLSGDGGPSMAALAAIRVLCDVLAYVHGEGVVHRDLKPENVVLGADGVPTLVDFGLVVRGGGSREAVGVEEGIVGTAAYMSPEQCRGEPVDARADMYALGCMLFEALTGRPPFAEPSQVQTILCHMSTRPPRPSDLVPALPAGVDELVLHLLAKEPESRTGHASGVASVLASLFGLAGSPESWPRPRAYLYRPTLAGREAALADLERSLSSLARGAGGIVLLLGESGVGKTRIANEVGRRAVAAGMTVLTGACAAGTGSELQAFRRPLRAIGEACREKGGAEVRRVFGPSLAALVPHEESLGDLATDLPALAPLPPALHRRRLQRALRSVLEAVAARAPLLLLLDDLQWADGETASFLSEMARKGAFARGRVLVLGTARSEEPVAWLQDPVFPAESRLSIGRLQATDLARLSEGMLAAPADPVFVQFLFEASGGNPLFAAEYLRACVGAGILDRDARGSWRLRREALAAPDVTYRALPLPSTMRELLARRLADLPGDGRGLVALGSIMASPADEEVVRIASGLDARAFDAALREPLRREILVDQGGGRIAFSHDKLREVALASLEPGSRAGLHERVARAMETAGGVAREGPAGELGRHWAEAGERPRAAAAYLASARRAAARHAAEDARRCFRTYLSMVAPDDPERIEATAILADLLRQGARAAEARQVVEGELARATDAASRARLLTALGASQYNQGLVAEAGETWAEALRLARDAGVPRQVATISGNLGVVCHERGDLEEALRLYEEALAGHRASGDRAMEGLLLGNVAALRQQQGRHDEAEKLYEEALEVVRAGGSRVFEGRTLSNLAVIHQERGKLREATQLFEAALAVHGEVGDLLFEGITLQNLANAYDEQGRLDDAEELHRRARSRHRASGDRSHEVATASNLAQLALQRGRLQEARVLADEALALAAGAVHARFQAIISWIIGNIDVAEGNVDQGVESLRRALTGIEAFGDRRIAALVRLSLAAARRSQGAFDLAEQELDAAEGPLGAVGSPIDLAWLDCERGHLDLARGGDGRAALARARGRTEGLDLRPSAATMRRIAALAAEAGD